MFTIRINKKVVATEERFLDAEKTFYRIIKERKEAGLYSIESFGVLYKTLEL